MKCFNLFTRSNFDISEFTESYMKLCWSHAFKLFIVGRIPNCTEISGLVPHKRGLVFGYLRLHFVVYSEFFAKSGH